MANWFTIAIHAPALSDLEARACIDALDKAVAPHPSQARTRDKAGRFRRYSWRTFAPRGEKGRFISRLTDEEKASAQNLSEVYRSDYHKRMQWHMGDCEAERLTAKEAGERGADEIKHYYELVYRSGLQSGGNPGLVISPTERAMINRLVSDEIEYWRVFMADVSNGAGSIPYPDRCSMYANAARQMHWLGFVMASHSPRRRIYWTLGPTHEKCSTCLTMAERSPWKIEDFMREAVANGFLPQGGDLECKGIRCQCSLSETVIAKKKQQ